MKAFVCVFCFVLFCGESEKIRTEEFIGIAITAFSPCGFQPICGPGDQFNRSPPAFPSKMKYNGVEDIRVHRIYEWQVLVRVSFVSDYICVCVPGGRWAAVVLGYDYS